MEYDHDILKDIIIETFGKRTKSPTGKHSKEDIIIELVWDWEIRNTKGTYIMVDYRKDEQPVTHSILKEDYLDRIKNKRDTKLNDLGI